MTTFDDRIHIMRALTAQGHLQGLPGQSSGTLGKFRDLIGHRFAIHRVSWHASRFDKDGQFALVEIELEDAPSEIHTYATSGAWVTRQLQRLTEEDYDLVYTVRELTEEPAFNGYHPLVLDYALDPDRLDPNGRGAKGPHAAA